MNNLQEIVDEMKADLEIADQAIAQMKKLDASTERAMFVMYSEAISKYLPKLESLLPTDEPHGGDEVAGS